MQSSSSVRKSAFGRTSLFLTNDENALVRTIRTVSGAMRRRDGSIYHNLDETAKHSKKIHCWHCCEPITGEAYCVPKSYDPGEKVFYVFGHFHSLPCAKAFILEQASFDYGHQINVFTKMARDVYGITENIVEAPPRITLTKFGGPFDIRKHLEVPKQTRLIEPPFVSYCMLVEERNIDSSLSDTVGMTIPKINDGAVDADEFAEPPPTSMYDDYMEAHKEDQETQQRTPTAAPTTRKKRASINDVSASKSTDAPSANTLQRFFKKS